MALVLAATLVSVIGGSGVTTGAQTVGPAPGYLPPVTFSSHTWHEGDHVTVAGSGCNDPKTHSSAGLEVSVYRTISAGRGGGMPLKTITARVSSNGTFRGTGTIIQPLAPEGEQDVVVICQKAGSGPYSAGVRGRTDRATIVAPSLPDLTVAAGSTFRYQLPCSIDGGEYGSFLFQLEGVDVGFGVPGKFPYDLSPNEGDVVEIAVPSTIAPGTYPASASCEISESGAQAYFNHFTVTITPVGTPNTTTTPRPTTTSVPAMSTTTMTTTVAPTTRPDPAGPAPAATPVSGSPTYTG